MTAAARPHRHRTLLAYAATTVALVTLGACSGGDPAPTVTTPPTGASSTSSTSTAAPTTTTPTPSTTPSVDPVLAKIPAQARTNTKDGAGAFARFYFGTLNAAFRSGDRTLLAALALPDCKTCAAFTQGVEDLADKNRRYDGDLVKVTSASSLSFSAGSKRVLLEIDQQSVPILDKSGARVDETPAGQASFIATLEFRAGRWFVERLQKVTS